MLDNRLTRRAALCGASAVGIAAALGAHGTGWAGAQTGSPVAASTIEDYPEVVITASEYHLDLPASIPAGLTRLTLKNEGTVLHHAMFMRVNEGSTLAELQAALMAPDFGPIFAASTSLGGPEVDPGLQASTIVELQPGQYMVICVIPDADGTPHYMMGMQAAVEVTAATGAEPEPAADETIELTEFTFGSLPRQVAPGRQLWAVTNAGEQPHEFLVLQLAPGVSFDDALRILDQNHAITPEAGSPATPEAAAAGGPPPFAFIGGAAPMSARQTNWAVLDLEGGEHFAVCFLPDPATGAPHFALGMIMPLTVG